MPNVNQMATVCKKVGEYPIYVPITIASFKWKLKMLSIILQPWLSREVPEDLPEGANVMPIQEEHEGGSRKLQVCQPDLNAWQGYGTHNPECYHTKPTGDQKQLAQV